MQLHHPLIDSVKTMPGFFFLCGNTLLRCLNTSIQNTFPCLSVLLIPALTIYTEGEMEIQLNLNFTPYDFPRYQQKR
jgi:hypothetical protein